MGQLLSKFFHRYRVVAAKSLAPAAGFLSGWSVVTCRRVNVWESEASCYALDQHPYRCIETCDCLWRSVVCGQYFTASLESGTVLIERYKAPAVTVSLSKLQPFLHSEFGVKKHAQALRHELALLCAFYPDPATPRRREAILPCFLDLESTTNPFGQGSQTDDEPMCLGMIISRWQSIQCDISPDLCHTAILHYCSACYYLFIFNNISLYTTTDEEGTPEDTECKHYYWPEQNHRHLVQVVRLGHGDCPLFAFDPRYGHSQLGLTSYEVDCNSDALDLAVIKLSPESKEKVSLVSGNNQLLPPMIGDINFNLLYSKDGELVFMQKMPIDNPEGVVHSHIFVFDSNDLNLLKHIKPDFSMSAEICKLGSEPGFSWCGNYMRLLEVEKPNNSLIVKVYQLPHFLHLMSICRRAILHQLKSHHDVDKLPLAEKVKNYLRFKPIY